MFGFEYEWVSNRLDRRKCHPALYLPPWQSCHMLQSLPHLPYPPKLDFLQASFKIFLAESISRAKCITDIAILNSASAKRNIILQIAKTAGGCYIWLKGKPPLANSAVFSCPISSRPTSLTQWLIVLDSKSSGLPDQTLTSQSWWGSWENMTWPTKRQRQRQMQRQRQRQRQRQ